MGLLEWALRYWLPDTSNGLWGDDSGLCGVIGDPVVTHIGCQNVYLEKVQVFFFIINVDGEGGEGASILLWNCLCTYACFFCFFGRWACSGLGRGCLCVGLLLGP